MTPGILVESEKVFEVGRDCHWRTPVNHKAMRKGGKGGIRTGGMTSNLYSSLDMEDDLCRLGVFRLCAESTVMAGIRMLGV